MSLKQQLVRFLTSEKIRKVPHVTLIFWIVKLLTTAMGEVTSDFLVQKIDPVIAVILGGIGLLIALLLQLFMNKYIPWVYWFAVVMVAIFGTMAADVLHIGLGIPYVVSSSFFAICLAIIFVLWYLSEKTLSIHSITTLKREIFYWATVMATFALGTAVGDMTATTLHLGYLDSGILFGIFFLLPALGYFFFRLPEVPMFWIAYILTRPLGASFADYFGKPIVLGGMGVGTGVVSAILTVAIIICLVYITKKHNASSLIEKAI